jgi:hypothetical protein
MRITRAWLVRDELEQKRSSVRRMNITTQGNLKHNPFADFFKERRSSNALRVQAFADLSQASWLYRITDANGQMVACDLGQLPPYYDNLRWTHEAALHYAFARAERWIKRERPQAHVAMTCCQPVRRQGREARRRWAA